MRRFEKLQIIRNVSSNWVALAINVLVGIFLTPFILHRLGDAAYGIWVLIFSITGYYGLFDLGIRSSLVRYVARAKASGDLNYASKIINTSLFTYSCLGAFGLMTTVLVSAYVNTFFHVDAQFHATTPWLLLMVGAAVSLGFPLGVSSGVLEALQRFDVLGWTSIASTLARAALIVVALRHGYGLLMAVFITVALPIVAYRLRFKSDSIIIGTFLSSVAITYFSIGSRIVDYAGEVVDGLAQIFAPMSSHSDALGDKERLRKIFVAGNRFCAFIIFPISAVLIILGRSVIEAWVGARYVAHSYPVLLILLIPTALILAQAASPRVLLGMNRHRTWAIVVLVEGIVNIILSVLLVRPYGIVGDAIGTGAPLAATAIFFLPGHVCRQLQIRMRTYLREAYLLPLIVCTPVVFALLAMKQWFVPHSYLQLAMHLTVAGSYSQEI